jgi:methylase of polypeptide subunit release factors
LLTSNLIETYDVLLDSSSRILKRGGFLVFEIGFGQSERIQSLVRTNQNFSLKQIREDHQRIPRTFVVQKIVDV